MSGFQDEVMKTVDKIDAFLDAVSADHDAGMLALRGSVLLGYAKELEEEAGHYADTDDMIRANIAEQLQCVLRMEIQSLERVVDALKSENTAEKLVEESKRMIGIKDMRSRLWKEIGKESQQ